MPRQRPDKALKRQGKASPEACSLALCSTALRGESGGVGSDMFTARSIELDGSLVVAAPVDAAFELFSPLGEKLWVPGWDPELINPAGSSWEPGLVFRTRDGLREAVWIVSMLDRLACKVEYQRFEADRSVARVRVACSARSSGETDVRVRYLFVGLSEAGNQEIALMTPEAHAERMLKWQGWIGRHIGGQAGQEAKQR